MTQECFAQGVGSQAAPHPLVEAFSCHERGPTTTVLLGDWNVHNTSEPWVTVFFSFRQRWIGWGVARRLWVGNVYPSFHVFGSGWVHTIPMKAMVHVPPLMSSCPTEKCGLEGPNGERLVGSAVSSNSTGRTNKTHTHVSNWNQRRRRGERPLTTTSRTVWSYPFPLCAKRVSIRRAHKSWAETVWLSREIEY